MVLRRFWARLSALDARLMAEVQRMSLMISKVERLRVGHKLVQDFPDAD